MYPGVTPPRDGVPELLNVYDSRGQCVGALPRGEARASGMAVGAINVLLVNGRGQVLLQRRTEDKENGGLWDKSVGGHVGAGEAFDDTAVRECGEELFDDGGSDRVRLAHAAADFAHAVSAADLAHTVVLRPVSRHLNLRDVRRAPGGGFVNVLYHVGIYYGRTELAAEAFRPQAEEIRGLRWASPAEIDALLLRQELAPNMAFLWLGHAQGLLSLGARG